MSPKGTTGTSKEARGELRTEDEGRGPVWRNILLLVFMGEIVALLLFEVSGMWSRAMGWKLGDNVSSEFLSELRYLEQGFEERGVGKIGILNSEDGGV